MNYNSQPPTPMDCTSTVTYADVTFDTAIATVDHFIAPAAYVTSLSLAPNANINSLDSVSWTNPATVPATESYSYQSNLWSVGANGNLGSQLWFVGPLTGSPAYTGPALMTNTPYEIAVATHRMEWHQQDVCCANFWALLKIQISSQYGVAHKKLLLTYQSYAASQFFARALSCLEL